MTGEDRSRPFDVGKAASRTIRDPDGIAWTVHEVTQPEYDRRSAHSLIFQNDEAMRRIRTYPSNWMDLSDADLWRIACGR